MEPFKGAPKYRSNINFENSGDEIALHWANIHFPSLKIKISAPARPGIDTKINTTGLNCDDCFRAECNGSVWYLNTLRFSIIKTKERKKIRP